VAELMLDKAMLQDFTLQQLKPSCVVRCWSTWRVITESSSNVVAGSLHEMAAGVDTGIVSMKGFNHSNVDVFVAVKAPSFNRIQQGARVRLQLIQHQSLGIYRIQ
jgi:hypothetical protein